MGFLNRINVWRPTSPGFVARLIPIHSHLTDGNFVLWYGSDSPNHTHPFIFLDIHLEPLDGFAMLKLIRQNKDYQLVQVLALTASVMNGEVRKLKEAGFDGVIPKPLNYDIFPDVLQRILNGEQVWNVK